MNRIDWKQAGAYGRCKRCGERDKSGWGTSPSAFGGSVCEDKLACRARRDLMWDRHLKWRRSIFPWRRRRAKIAYDLDTWQTERELERLTDAVGRLAER